MEDLEAALPYYQTRPANKKMKKRKQLDALLKFRSSPSTTNRNNSRLSNENLLTSEDELFLPDQKTILKKSSSLRYRRCCSYTRHILSVCLVCIFMIICVGLAYANIELKNEVQNLSARVSDIEKRFSTVEINRILSTMDQIKSRLALIERWNVSYLYERLNQLRNDVSRLKSSSNPLETEMSMNDEEISSKLTNLEEKSKVFSEVDQELQKLSQDADQQAKNLISSTGKPLNRAQIEDLLEQERRSHFLRTTNQLIRDFSLLNQTFYNHFNQWQKDFNSLRNENQSVKIEQFATQLEELANLMKNSSTHTSTILTNFQSQLDQLRTAIENCKCSKDSLPVKPSIVDSDQLQQSLVTKTNVLSVAVESDKTIDADRHST